MHDQECLRDYSGDHSFSHHGGRILNSFCKAQFSDVMLRQTGKEEMKVRCTGCNENNALLLLLSTDQTRLNRCISKRQTRKKNKTRARSKLR